MMVAMSPDKQEEEKEGKYTESSPLKNLQKTKSMHVTLHT
jgi:hypothetical protein